MDGCTPKLERLVFEPGRALPSPDPFRQGNDFPGPSFFSQTCSGGPDIPGSALGCWLLALDSTDPAFAGQGSALPGRISPGDSLGLPPESACLYLKQRG